MDYPKFKFTHKDLQEIEDDINLILQKAKEKGIPLNTVRGIFAEQLAPFASR